MDLPDPPLPGGLHVEVAYARPDVQLIIGLDVAPGTTAEQAVHQSGILTRFPDIDPAAPIGVFGRVVEPGYVLRPGDRVEIYRPLKVDPKDARRKRAAAEGSGGSA